MPKNSKEQISDDEKKIIRELQKNSKENIDNIAKKCGFSRQKVWRIIRRLEKNKTIWGYHAVVDDNKLGQKKYFIMIKRTSKAASQDKMNLVLKRELKQEAEKVGVTVESSYFIHGVYDWLLCITTESIAQVKKFCEVLNFLYKEGFVSDIQIFEVIFPVEVNNFNNPNMDEFLSFF
jgi:DNA-binding Lrp family transcriptional regulator